MSPSSTDQAVMSAMQCIGTGQLQKAEEICAALLEKHPLSAPVLHAAGLVAYMKRDYATAIGHISKAVQVDDSNCQYFSNLGEANRRIGRLEEALAAFDRAIVLKPDFLKGHLGAGNTLRDMGKFPEAISKFRLALAINPNFAEAYHYLGVTFVEQENFADAVPVLRKAVALRPAYGEAQLTLAGALEQIGRSEEALALYRRILERDPKNVAVLNNAGNILKNLGRMDEAVEHYQKALEIDPDHAPAYYNLSRSQVSRNEGNDTQRMEEMLKDESLDVARRINLHFALGKIYDDLGLYHKAFHHFEAGNALDTRGEPFNADAHSMVINRIMAVFNKQFLSSHRGMGSESDLPVFIVGVPRSGTTLAEQILSSHPRVFGAGELAEIGGIASHLADAVGSGNVYPEAAMDLDALTAVKLAERYVGYLQGIGGGALRVTDKMPGNFIHLGLISLLLPNAKIINCRRDPIDVSLSCYFQHFTAIMPFSRTLTDLGRYYLDYHRLMAHWRKVLPMEILDVDYEDMIADHEGMSRKIVAFAGLEWDDACLEFYNLDRPVKTASSWQVRQPIYSSSVARWQNYKKFIGPLQEIIDRIPDVKRATKPNKPTRTTRKAAPTEKKKARRKATAPKKSR